MKRGPGCRGLLRIQIIIIYFLAFLPSRCPSHALLLKPMGLRTWSPCTFYITYILVSKPTHLAKLGEITGKTRVLCSKFGEITGKTRVLYSKWGKITGKTRVLPCGHPIGSDRPPCMGSWRVEGSLTMNNLLEIMILLEFPKHRACHVIHKTSVLLGTQVLGVVLRNNGL